MRGKRVLYSAAELEFVKSNCTMARKDLRAVFAARFGRDDVTADQLRGLCDGRGWFLGRKSWTAADDAALRELYATTSTEDIMRRLGRSRCAVYGRANTLGLGKSEAYQANLLRHLGSKLAATGAGNRFVKGQVPPNKGLRRPGWSAGRMKETQFKKGDVTNWSPIGTEKIHVSPVNPNRSKENRYWYRKIADVRNVPWTRNWKALHIIQWEELHGRPLPRAHALKCLDGDQLNTDPANWILVSRAELLHLNRMYRGRFDTAPADVKPAMLTMVKLRLAQAAAKKKESAA